MDLTKTVLKSKNALHLGTSEVTDQGGHFNQKNRVASAMCVFNFF